MTTRTFTHHIQHTAASMVLALLITLTASVAAWGRSGGIETGMASKPQDVMKSQTETSYLMSYEELEKAVNETKAMCPMPFGTFLILEDVSITPRRITYSYRQNENVLVDGLKITTKDYVKRSISTQFASRSDYDLQRMLASLEHHKMNWRIIYRNAKTGKQKTYDFAPDEIKDIRLGKETLTPAEHLDYILLGMQAIEGQEVLPGIVFGSAKVANGMLRMVYKLTDASEMAQMAEDAYAMRQTFAYSIRTDQSLRPIVEALTQNNLGLTYTILSPTGARLSEVGFTSDDLSTLLPPKITAIGALDVKGPANEDEVLRVTGRVDDAEVNVKMKPELENKVFDVVEQMPAFPGGPTALMQYLAQNIKYPVVAHENGVQGRVVVSFVVEKDGSIADVRVVRSIDPSLDHEAVRVVKAMPYWTPGRQDGKPVRVKYNVPVNFRLTDDAPAEAPSITAELDSMLTELDQYCPLSLDMGLMLLGGDFKKAERTLQIAYKFSGDFAVDLQLRNADERRAFLAFLLAQLTGLLQHLADNHCAAEVLCFIPKGQTISADFTAEELQGLLEWAKEMEN